jgi:hypothetical protein
LLGQQFLQLDIFGCQVLQPVCLLPGWGGRHFYFRNRGMFAKRTAEGLDDPKPSDAFSERSTFTSYLRRVVFYLINSSTDSSSDGGLRRRAPFWDLYFDQRHRSSRCPEGPFSMVLNVTDA